jgi:hypothetical protein
MVYEIWETESRNLVGDFPTEAAAVATVREALALHGRSYVSTWVLAREDADGETSMVADGEQLLVLAQRASA